MMRATCPATPSRNSSLNVAGAPSGAVSNVDCRLQLHCRGKLYAPPGGLVRALSSCFSSPFFFSNHLCYCSTYLCRFFFSVSLSLSCFIILPSATLKRVYILEPVHEQWTTGWAFLPFLLPSFSHHGLGFGDKRYDLPKIAIASSAPSWKTNETQSSLVDKFLWARPVCAWATQNSTALSSGSRCSGISFC